MKLFHKLAVAFVGASMAIGVGVVAARNSGDVEPVRAAENTVAWTASSGSLGTGIGSGTIKTGTYSWDYERTLVSGTSYTGWSSSCVQLGKNGGVENITFTTSNIPGTIKSVYVECASYNGAHKVGITVGGTSYLASTSTSSWTTVASKGGTGSSSGEIVISFTNGTRALYIKSITVVYEEAGGPEIDSIEASLKDSEKVWKKGQTFSVTDVSVYVLYDDSSDATVTDGAGVKFGASANQNSVTLVAGNNTIRVNYGGFHDDIVVFAKAVTSVTIVANQTTLNANGNTSVSADVEYEVAYNTTPASVDYAATFTCETAGWTKSADDGEGNVTFTFESNGTYEFTLTANDDAEQTDTITFTVSGIPAVEYELFSGTLENGKYVIVSGSSALKAVISNSRGAYATVTPANDKIISPASNIVWDIEAATVGGKTGYTIHNTAGYFSATGSDGNATLLATATSKSVWACTEDSGSYEFINQDPKTSTKANLRLNDGYGFATYGTTTGTSLTLYKLHEVEKTITASRMTAGTVSATTGDEEWTLSGFAFEVLYDGDSEYTNVTANTTFGVSPAVPDIQSNGTLAVTVTPTFKDVEYTAKAANVTATLTYSNIYTIAQLYDNGATNTAYVVDGVYMGEVSDGYIFMNGEYGILDYDTAHSKTLSIGESYTLSGTRATYSGLIELKNVTATLITSAERKGHIATPVVYEVVGGETANKANRKTSLTGVVVSMSSTSTGADSTVQVDIGGEDNIAVFVKASAAIEKVMNALKDSRDNTKTITIEGFTSWHSGFQVALTDVVIPDNNYTQYDFARDLLKLTKGVCNSSYDGVTSNKSALVSIWSTLDGAEYYGKLTGEHLSAVVSGTANKNIEVPATNDGIDAMSDANALAAALYRYDYCTAKYELDEFIDGRTLSVSFSRYNAVGFVNENNNSTAIIITVIATVSLITVGAYFLLKKKHA